MSFVGMVVSPESNGVPLPRYQFARLALIRSAAERFHDEVF